jgi:hypothetical protein
MAPFFGRKGDSGREALGRGANRLVIDDPHPPADAWSDAGLEPTIKFCRGSLFSRQTARIDAGAATGTCMCCASTRASGRVQCFKVVGNAVGTTGF